MQDEKGPEIVPKQQRVKTLHIRENDVAGSFKSQGQEISYFN